MNPQSVNQYQAVIKILQLMQGDYHRARNELRELTSHFSERETVAGRQLRATLDSLSSIASTGKMKIVTRLSETLPEEISVVTVRGKGSGKRIIPILEVFCLGAFRVRVDDKMIDHWSSTKAKSLLKYLITQKRKPVSKDVLMEALWPDCEPSLANNNLKAAVRSLRLTLRTANDVEEEFNWILHDDGSYVINPEASVWEDVEQFEYHWLTGRQLEKEGRLTDTVRELELALVLYKGDYLEDSLYEDWTSLRREGLKDIYLALLARLADYSMEKTDYAGCTQYCMRILKEDACREDAYQRLMCSHFRLGQRSRAIEWYLICEKVLKSELNVSPNRKTVRLYHKLMSDAPI